MVIAEGDMFVLSAVCAFALCSSSHHPPFSFRRSSLLSVQFSNCQLGQSCNTQNCEVRVHVEASNDVSLK
jgi:hypothetical protein